MLRDVGRRGLLSVGGGEEGGLLWRSSILRLADGAVGLSLSESFS